MDSKRMVSISKALSKTLRHDPARVGVSLDSAGWVDVDELLAAFGRKGMAISPEELAYVVEHSDKQRFALADGRIRANQGHSVEIDLGLEVKTPPSRLFHGTATPRLDSILESGLDKGSRHHVHLSADVETATRVGSRHGVPVVLVVRASEMVDDGHEFFLSDNGVWLVDAVPPCFLELAEPASS